MRSPRRRPDGGARTRPRTPRRPRRHTLRTGDAIHGHTALTYDDTDHRHSSHTRLHGTDSTATLTATTRLHTLSAALIAAPDANHAWGPTTTVGYVRISCSNRTRCHSITRRGPQRQLARRPGSAMPGATHALGRDCRPHMQTTQNLLAQGRETRRLLIGVLRREGPVPRVTYTRSEKET